MKLITGWILTIALISPAFCQVSSYKVNIMSREDGLPSDNIISTYQDSYGYLWLASYEGLTRWDGSSYRQYVHSRQDSSSISANIVYTIMEDHKKRLWVGTIDGLNLYDRETDSFVRCDIGIRDAGVPVNDIAEDSKRQLWLATSFGLCRFDIGKNEAQWYVHDPDNINSLSHDVVFQLAIDSHDNLWLATFEGGVNKFHPPSGAFTHLLHQPGDAETICSNKIKSIFTDYRDRIWVGSYDRGISVLNTEGQVIEHIRAFPDDKDGRPIRSEVTSIYEDAERTLWIGIKGQLLHYREKGSDTFRPFTNTAYASPQRSCLSVTSISEDTFGNIWFASPGHGLFHTNLHKNYFHHFHTGNGLSHNVVTAIQEDRSGNVWIGTEGGGLSRYEPRANRFKHYSTNEGLSSDAILEIREDAAGNLWLATWSGGIMKFDPHTESVTAFVNNPADDATLILNNVKSLLPLDSIIWVGTHGEGLVAYDLMRKRFISHENNTVFPFNLKAPAWINHLFMDSKKRLWVSTYGGLFLYEKEGVRQFVPTNVATSISSDVVNMVAEDNEGRIWIATESGGLDLFDEATAGFQCYSKLYNLPGNIKSITIDKKGRLWLGSTEGIVSFDPTTRESRRYDQTDGLQGNAFFHKSAFTGKNGMLYFGGQNGLNFFHPDSLRERKEQANLPVYFTNLSIYDQKQAPEQPGSPLTKVLAATDTLVLNHRQSFFSIEYVALNLYAPTRTQYAYQLEGLHDNWINTGFETKASFTDLDPGRYVFKVKYTDQVGTWHESPKRLHIVILPPWWKTWWFTSLVTISVAIGVILFFYGRFARIRQQNRLLEQEVMKRTQELSEANAFLVEKNEEIKLQNEKLEEFNTEILRQSEKILLQQKENITQNQQLEKTVQELHRSNQTKDRFFSILAHDLRNPVSALAAMAESLHVSLPGLAKKQVDEYVESINRSSRSVYNLLTNLLNWARTQSREIEYAPVDFDLADLIRKNIALLDTQARNKEIRVEFPPSAGGKVFADYNMMDTVVRNLIDNSIKFSRPGSVILLRCEESKDMVTVDVTDTGIGMSDDQLKDLFRIDKKFLAKGTAGEAGTGLGLVIAREFVEANKGSITATSEAGKGSRFIFSLPVSRVLTADDPGGDISRSSLLDGIFDFPEEKLLKIKGKRLLIIDDDPELRRYLRVNLSGTFEIFEAEDGSEGLARALEVQPAVIITDMMMPVMDGEQFCKEVKKLPATSHIPVILLTSQSFEEGQLVGYGAGADVYLTKPARKELILQLIYNFVHTQEKIHRQILDSSTYYPEDVAMNKVDEDFLGHLMRIIENNISDPGLDYKLICDETALSRTVLYSKLKALTGQGVNEFIRSIRLKKSVSLLREGKLNISQIALEVGFNSHSYFNKCFQKQYNASPKEFAKNLRNGAVAQ